MVPAQNQDGAVKAADSAKDRFEIMKILNEGIIMVINQMDSILQTWE